MSRTPQLRALLALLFAGTVLSAAGVRGDSLSTAADSTVRGGAKSAATPESLAESLEAPTRGSATSPEPTAAETTGAARPAVPVFLGGRQVFVVHSPRNGLDPAQRAVAIRKRIDAAVADRATPADSVWMRRSPEGIEVWLGRHFLWMIAHGDAEGMSVPQLAVMVGDLPSQVTRGILRERSGRSPRGVLIAVLIAIGLTVVASVLARLLVAASRRWRAFLDRGLPKYLRGFRIGTFEVLSQQQLTGIVGGILARADLVVGALLLYGYLTALFSLFPWSQGWSWQLLHFAREELVAAAIAVGRAIPNLLVLAGIFLLFRWLVRLSNHFFDAVDQCSVQVSWLHQELARPTKRLVGIGLWICAAAVAYPYLPGSQSKAVQGVSILLGVMVSIGSSGIVGNVIAGIVLTYSRSFSKGDRVQIGEIIGDVVNLGFFATKLRTPRNEEVTVPNGQLANQPILNYTRLAKEAGLILHTQVTIGYDADWRTVHSLLIEAAGRVEGVEREPVPWVFQSSLNDYHITYEICCVTRRSHEQLLLYGRLHQEIQDAFSRGGVEILSPMYNALRDANAQVLPKEPPGPREAPGGFRVRPTGGD
jgi:small-conductance mechanosensitive channel